MERRVLGKGLNALIPEIEQKQETAANILNTNIEDVFASKYQPRVEFDDTKLQELMQSIKEKGVVQPLLVREKTIAPGITQGYELIAGERRLRAAKMLGLKQVPIIVKNVNDTELLELSLIENLQRENLNPIEEANAYNRLIEEFSFTQEQVARVVGKDRSTVTNVLRLLNLPQEVRELITQDKINLGHAKVILSLNNRHDQIKIAQRIAKDDLSVRQTEQLVTPKSKKIKSKAANYDPNIQAIEKELQRALGTKVKIFAGRKRGKIQIEYYSIPDLERILKLLNK